MVSLSLWPQVSVLSHACVALNQTNKSVLRRWGHIYFNTPLWCNYNIRMGNKSWGIDIACPIPIMFANTLGKFHACFDRTWDWLCHFDLESSASHNGSLWWFLGQKNGREMVILVNLVGTSVRNSKNACRSLKIVLHWLTQMHPSLFATKTEIGVSSRL